MDIVWSIYIILHSNLKTYFFVVVVVVVCSQVESWLVREIFPVHQTGCPVKSRKLS